MNVFILKDAYGKFVYYDSVAGMPATCTDRGGAERFKTRREALEWAGANRVIDDVAMVEELHLVVKGQSAVTYRERILAKGW